LAKHYCNYFYGRTIETSMRGDSQRMKYCPICGKLLGENNILSLKELNKHVGKPLYIVCFEFPKLNGWYIVHFDKQTKRIECWGYDSVKFDSINYNDVWVAYLQKPINI
jgi:hypothetical protein